MIREKISTAEHIKTDILVCGAGASGIPAAITAARCGSKVVLIEEDMMPGGAPVDNYVTYLCGGPRVGIYKEIIERLNAEYDISGHPIDHFNCGIGTDHWYLPSSYIRVLMDMIHAESNIRLICGARATSTIVNDEGNRNRVSGVVVSCTNGKELYIEAQVTIDATGTGIIAEMSGCETRYGRDAKKEFNECYAPDVSDQKVMPCTWMYISQRIGNGPVPDIDRLAGNGFVESNLGWTKHHEEEYKKLNTGIYLHWGVTVDCDDTRNPVSLAKAQHKAFEKVKKDMDILNEYHYAVYFAPFIGVRESRRVIGEYVITMNDLLSKKFPQDVIAINEYALDLWGQKLSDKPIFTKAGIPYGALIPKNTEGLLVAGKSISGTHIAMSSYRVQPIVASIGQAAGVASDLAVKYKTGVRSIPIEELQNRLKKMGVI